MTYVMIAAGLLLLAVLAGCSERRMCGDPFAYVAQWAPPAALGPDDLTGARHTAALPVAPGR